MSKRKKCFTTDLIAILEDLRCTSYYELSLLTGKSRNQLARAIKYLRNEGYLIRTTNKAGRYVATIEYVGAHDVHYKR